MKTIILTGAVVICLLTATNQAQSQANRNLSNLMAPTAVNQHLLPKSSNSKDLGSDSKRWRNLFLCNKAGINVNPQYPLDIYNTDYYMGINAINPTLNINEDRIGVYAQSVITDNWGYGVQAIGGYFGLFASGYLGTSSDVTHGVYGQAIGTACTGVTIGSHGVAVGAAYNYGVIGDAFDSDDYCGGFNAAGYFAGDVYAVNFYTASDRKFKANIEPVKNSLQQLMKLKPSSYEYKTKEFPKMGLAKGKQTGLIADEVKQVFPAFVKTAVRPASYDKDRKQTAPEVKYEAVNYMQFIPVLIASIQEQQTTIDAITAENRELKKRLDAIEQTLFAGSSLQAPAALASLAEARLEQNAPNPFSQKTTISYFVPQKAGSAALVISDMNGKLIKTLTLSPMGKGQVVLDANQLAAGTYQYTLVVNGTPADSKKMILTK